MFGCILDMPDQVLYGFRAPPETTNINVAVLFLFQTKEFSSECKEGFTGRCDKLVVFVAFLFVFYCRKIPVPSICPIA